MIEETHFQTPNGVWMPKRRPPGSRLVPKVVFSPGPTVVLSVARGPREPEVEPEPEPAPQKRNRRQQGVTYRPRFTWEDFDTAEPMRELCGVDVERIVDPAYEGWLEV